MMTGHDTSRFQHWSCVEMLARHSAHDAMAGPHCIPLAVVPSRATTRGHEHGAVRHGHCAG